MFNKKLKKTVNLLHKDISELKDKVLDLETFIQNQNKKIISLEEKLQTQFLCYNKRLNNLSTYMTTTNCEHSLSDRQFKLLQPDEMDIGSDAVYLELCNNCGKKFNHLTIQDKDKRQLVVKEEVLKELKLKVKNVNCTK